MKTTQWFRSTAWVFAVASVVAWSGCGKKCTEESCLNGGVCVDGECNCPPGYSGNSCEKENTPKSLTVRKIKLVNIARTYPSGREFDPAEFPDVYVVIRRGLEKVVHTSPVFNVRPGQVVELDVGNGAFLFTSSDYTLELWDEDRTAGAAENELMAEVTFRPWKPGGGFPEWLEIALENGRHTVAIKLEYQW